MLHSPGQQHQVNVEAFAYQLIMPSIAEEPMYRAIVPALLAAAIGSPWTFCGAKVGWWWLAIAAYFGFGHAVQSSPDVGLTFQTAPFLLTGTVGFVFGWMAARCGSVRPCVLGHTLINAPVFAIPLAVKSLQTAKAIYFTFSLAA